MRFEMSDRASILAATVMLVALGWSANEAAWAEEAPPQPNILLIVADDQRWDTIRALGNHDIQTPNLDGLVQRGLWFSNAYCMGSMIGAVCLPSRTMLITGRSLWRIPENPRAKQPPPGVPLLPVELRNVGYQTFHCGKASNSCTFGNAAFETNIETQGRTRESATQHADKVLDFLHRRDFKRPFFIYLAPPVPHDPRLAPEEFARRYDPARLSLSKNFMPRHPFDNGELEVRDELLAPHPRTPEAMRHHLADYYATITHLDFEVGRVLAELERQGLTGQTIVIYTSDQGLAVGGRHGLMGKQNLYEHVTPPLVVAGPGVPQGRSDALVYLFDLFPTICELAGARTPPVVEGKSLVGLIQRQRTAVRPWLFGAYRDCQRMIRDERYKLIQYSARGVKHTQLFDLARDADELHNLADDRTLAGQRTHLEELMAQARRQFGDPVDFQADVLKSSQ